MSAGKYVETARLRSTILGGIALLITACTAAFLMRCQETASPAAGSVEEWARYMDDRIPELMGEYGVPGIATALIREGEVVWTGAYGYADEITARPMTTDTPCRVESISKSVTAWGVMKLVQDGLIDLDTPVAAYLGDWTLPETPYSEAEVTVRRLLSLTAGMPLGTIGVRYDPRGDIPLLEDHIRREAVLISEPGRGFSYSNAGYNLLELIIQRVTGEDFAVYMAREVLSPLEMDRAGFLWNGDWEPKVPDGHDIDGTAIPVYVYPDRASGGLFAPVGDIATFVTAGMPLYNHRGSRVLDNRSIEALYTRHAALTGYYSLVFDGYGFGHFIEEFPDGTRGVSHGGQGSGWMTHFHSIPETGDGIVILANSQRSWPLFSTVLDRWGRWSGHSPVGMGLIAQAAVGLRVFLALNLILILVVIFRAGADLLSRRRRLVFARRLFRGPRITLPVLALVLSGTVIAVSRMQYFFLSSVFPVETPWLGVMMLIWAGVLGAVFVLPSAGITIRNSTYSRSSGKNQ